MLLDQVATYYDTPDLRLLAAGVTLRRRTGGVDEGWHLKLPVADDHREEVRVPLEDSSTEIPEALLARVRGIVRDNPVASAAVLTTRRRVHNLLDEQGSVLAEFCDDHVHAETSSDSPTVEKWREWEVELVQGQDEFLDEVEAILVEAGARPAARASKLSHVLAEALPAQPAWRARAHVGKKASSADLLQGYLATHLARLEEQDRLLRTGDQEGVHKMRVAARRLRSALTTYAPVLLPDATTDLRADLKWLGGVLAEARDAQVLRERLTAMLEQQPDDLVLGPVRTRIDHRLREQFVNGRAAAGEALDSERYFRLLDRLEAFVAEPPLAEPARRRARNVVPDLMKRDLKRLRKRHRAFRKACSAHERDLALHEVRKSAKRLRYAAESARPVFRNRAKRLASRAEALQGLLGEHQDTVVARGVLRESWGCAHAGPATTASPSGACTPTRRLVPPSSRRTTRRRWPPCPARTSAPGCAADADACGALRALERSTRQRRPGRSACSARRCPTRSASLSAWSGRVAGALRVGARHTAGRCWRRCPAGLRPT